MPVLGVFLPDATLDADGTVVTLPVFDGIATDGDAVSYIVTEVVRP